MNINRNGEDTHCYMAVKIGPLNQKIQEQQQQQRRNI
jgi:hypothetical protein